MILSALGLVLASILSLLPIANPLSTAALFLSLTKQESKEARREKAKRACLYAFAILAVFFVAGGAIMSFFGISIPGLRIAGGIMLVKIAFSMMANDRIDEPSDQMLEQSRKEKGDIAFIPLAMPSISGPGAIATTISLTSYVENPFDGLAILIGIASLTLICFFTLVSSVQILRYIGPNGLEAFQKIMGFLILCIGVQFFVNGIVGFLSDPELMRGIIEAISTPPDIN